MNILMHTVLTIALTFLLLPAQAMTIWAGSDLVVTQDRPNAVTDVLVAGVASLGRGGGGLLCNTQLGDDCRTGRRNNPSNFEFAVAGLEGNSTFGYGSASSFLSLLFGTMRESYNRDLSDPSTHKRAAVGHIISEDIYFDFQITDWGDSEGDNFTYRRSTASVNALPEPSTFALLGLGLAGMGLARRRKKV